MKFLHIADVHLGAKLTPFKGVDDQPVPSIQSAILKAFTRCIDIALDEKVSFVLVAGDLFDHNWKDFSVGLFFIEQIRRLSCPVYYVRGNHDAENRLLKSLPYPKHLTTFESGKPHTIIDDSHKVAVHGVSYAHYHTQENLSQKFPKPIPGYFNIGLLHSSGCQGSQLEPYAPFKLSEIQDSKYDYWALGHLHQYQELTNSKPRIVYSGCVQGRHINELGIKGCVLVEVLAGGDTQTKLIPACSLIWEKVTLELAEDDNLDQLKTKLIALTSDVLSLNESQDFIFRFYLKGQTNLDTISSKTNDEWKHFIYCWLTEKFNRKIYIEKVVSLINIADSTHHKSESVLSELNLDEQDLVTMLTEEIEDLREKMPKGLRSLKIFDELQDELDIQNLKQQVETYTRSSLERNSV